MINPMSAIIKFINGRNDSHDYLSSAIDYITDVTKTDDGTLVATQGCSRSNALDDILVNKVLHHKSHGKQGMHFVLAFPPAGNAKSPADVLNVIREIVSTVYPDYLAVMAVHTDSKALHSHVILDSVNAVTGKKFSQGPGDLNRVKQRTNNILQAHGLEIIRMSVNAFVDHTDYSKATGFDFLEMDETELISEQDVQIVSLGAEIRGTNACFDIWRDYPLDTPLPSYYTGGQNAMQDTNAIVPATQQPETPAQNTTAITLTEQAVPTAASSSCYPTTTVVTGPTFRIKGTPQSDFTGLNELVTQTTAFAQEHQREAANLALAMQVKAQECIHPTNVTVVAGPIFDIDLCNRFEHEDDVVYGDYGD